VWPTVEISNIHYQCGRLVRYLESQIHHFEEKIQQSSLP